MLQSEFQFRSADSGDSSIAYELFVEVQTVHAGVHPEMFRSPVGFEEFDAYFSNVLSDSERQCVFACLAERPVGYVQFFLGTRAETLFRLKRRSAYVDQLVVSTANRRKGCASSLIQYVKNEAKRERIEFLGLDVWTFNGPALACFGNLGFQPIQEYMRLRV